MLSNAEVTEIECIFMLIDHGVIPDSVTIQFLNWLRYKNVERFALLEWMLNRWILLRQNKHHLPTRIEKNICLNNLI